MPLIARKNQRYWCVRKIRHFFVFSLILVILLVSDTAGGQDSLKILTWNVQMLPRFVKRNGKAKRARAIVEQIKQRQYDVVVFQELFRARSRKIITKGLAQLYPHHTPVLNAQAISLKTNGGVILFSKYPIREVHQIRYRQREGWDRISRKGALLAELDVKGKMVQVAGTHLQAFGPQEIMYSQYHQLAEELLIPHSKKGVPQLVCGDFNTLKTLPSQLPAGISQDFIDRLPRYHYMLQTLDAVDGELSGEQKFTMDRPYNDLCITRKDVRLLLDYIFLRPNGMKGISIQRKVQIMRQQWDKEHQDLSDHFGLEGVLTGF